MKLKSLLLGSAAALISVTGSNAADAVFAAEPEPDEYVKVCDTYGNGFFYIPGTETCINFNGYVRVEFIYTDTAATETTNWQLRGRLNIDARNETEWGTLRSQIRFQGNGRGGADANLTVDRALISLGGLRLGYSDTFVNTHHGYGWQLARNDGYYDFDQAVFLDYTFAANGFSATVGVQDTTSTAAVATGADVYDPYGGVAYSASWGRVAGSIIYDSSADELAWHVSANIKAIENIGINAWYMSDNGGTRYVAGGDGSIPAGNPAIEWQWGADVTYTVNSKFKVWAGYTDADFADAELIGLGAHWNPVPGFSVRPEALFGPDYTQVRVTVFRFF